MRRYRRPLLAYCRRITQEAAAEDVLQQALLQAWNALRAGVEVQEARAWLYRIVRNAAISFLRSVGEAPVKLADTVPASGVEHLVEQRLEAREALAQLAALPGLQRQVMLGTAVQGRSHEELAHELGVSGGSVRGLIYRARATLRAAAAALIPSPLVDWAVRSGARSAATAPWEAIAGGGSVGVAGALLKGGAAVTLAGLAGAAAIVTTHAEPRFARSPQAALIGSAHRPAGSSLPGARILVAETIEPSGGAIDTSRDSNSATGSAPVRRHDTRRAHTRSNPTSSTDPRAGRRPRGGEHRTRTGGTGGGWTGTGQGENSPPDRSSGWTDGHSHATEGGSAGTSGSETSGGSERISRSEATAAAYGTGSTSSPADEGSTGAATASGPGGSSYQRPDNSTGPPSGQSSANPGSQSVPPSGSVTQPSPQTTPATGTGTPAGSP